MPKTMFSPNFPLSFDRMCLPRIVSLTAQSRFVKNSFCPIESDKVAALKSNSCGKKKDFSHYLVQCGILATIKTPPRLNRCGAFLQGD
jgi:hypothetical protein